MPIHPWKEKREKFVVSCSGALSYVSVVRVVRRDAGMIAKEKTQVSLTPTTQAEQTISLQPHPRTGTSTGNQVYLPTDMQPLLTDLLPLFEASVCRRL